MYVHNNTRSQCHFVCLFSFPFGVEWVPMSFPEKFECALFARFRDATKFPTNDNRHDEIGRGMVFFTKKKRDLLERKGLTETMASFFG